MKLQVLARDFRRYWPLLAVAFLFFLSGWLRALPDTVDDAYITFRSVQNLVHGAGPGFNPGITVESFSNPLLVLLLIPWALLGVPLEIASSLLGHGAFLSIPALVGMYIHRMGVGGGFLVLGVACPLVAFPLLYYSITGLETGIFAALILAGCWQLHASGKPSPLSVAIWLGVAACRPEGVAYVIAMLCVLLLSRRSRETFGFAGVLLLLIFVGFLCRYLIFGLWLPNTFYAKPPGTASLDPDARPLLTSLQYVRDYMLGLGMVLPLLALAALFKNGWKLAILLPTGQVATGLAFAIYTGGDWFPAGRYLQPITPVLILLGVIGAREVYLVSGQRLRESLLVAGVFVSVLIGNSFILAEFWSWKDRYPFHVMNSRGNIEAGKWIRDNTPEDLEIVAFRIGAVGYFGERHIIDLFGLADHEIARLITSVPGFHPREQMGDDSPEIAEYIRSRNPGAVLPVNSVHFPVKSVEVWYGNQYHHVRSFRLGEDERFDLYIRGDIVEEMS